MLGESHKNSTWSITLGGGHQYLSSKNGLQFFGNCWYGNLGPSPKNKIAPLASKTPHTLGCCISVCGTLDK